MTLKGLIHGQASDYHHGHRIRHIAPDPTWCVNVSHGTCGQSVVTHYPLSNTNNIRPRSAALLVLEGSLSEPIVKGGLSRLKL